jgi:hypothetical protein
MNALRRWALVLWLGCAAACSAPAWAQADTDAARQLLVLLQLPPNHFRPDSTYSGSYGDALGAGARRRVAARIAREHGLGLGIDWPMPLLGLHCYVMSLPEGEPAEAALSALARDPAVAWAQPMHVYRTQGAHADPLFPAQPTASAWHLAELHDVATGREVRVAVIDSGVELDHPDLAGQVALAENFVAGRPYAAEQHGTGVAGLIAARADNGIGIVGVAPQSRLLALRACWQQSPEATLCNSLSLALALHFAIAHDAAVINLSLAGPPDRLLAALIDSALARGLAVVAAADRSASDGGFPASHRGVIAIVDDGAGAVPAGSLGAPGRDLPTTAPHAAWQLVSGASYAAAEVSGLFALLRELRGGAAGDAASVVLAGGTIDACATLMRAVRPGSPGCLTRAAAATLARP